jgi:hypothetical protein|tara:strand:+ start:711 stop:1799 length:1089 start_codon:yes stop_codon:yes gene_type:complete
MTDIDDISDKLKKVQLGQYFTTYSEYILQDLNIPSNVKTIVEPFAGNKDLLKKFNLNNYTTEYYDIDPKHPDIIKQDTLLNPLNLDNKFIITNPPYLARNKSSSKKLFDKYNVNDLYKCFISQIINSKCLGGILVIPLNFWCSIRLSDILLRSKFVAKYNIVQLNIFEEQVFDDTTYTICAFQFETKIETQPILITIYPINKKMNVILNEECSYSIGGNIYNLNLSNKYKITRATNKNKNNLNTHIKVKCIDDNIDNKIALSFVENKDELYIDKTPKLSSRTYASLIIEPSIDLEQQKKLIKYFNQVLNNHRIKYHSLFLTNYRESKDIARKRISFDLVYSLCSFILEKFLENNYEIETYLQ